MRISFKSDLEKVKQICEKYRVDDASFIIPFTLSLTDKDQRLMITGEFTYSTNYEEDMILHEKILLITGSIDNKKLHSLKIEDELIKTILYQLR